MLSRIDSGNYNINFKNNDRDDKKHVTAGEVATATGATAAGASATKGGSWNVFKRLSKNTGDTLKVTANAAKQTKKASSAFSRNVKYIKDSIIQWGEKFKNSRLLKPFFTNRLFKAVAGGIGTFTAVCIFISGIGDMVNTTVKSSRGIGKRLDRHC